MLRYCMTKEMGPVYSELHMLFMNLIKLSTFILSQKCNTLCKCFLFYITIVMYFQNIESLGIKDSDQLLQLAICCTKQDVI